MHIRPNNPGSKERIRQVAAVAGITNHDPWLAEIGPHANGGGGAHIRGGAHGRELHFEIARKVKARFVASIRIICGAG
jgi:hypothetical protein